MRKSRRPKTNCQRTFTACWTCRRRNVRCDNAIPHCSQCKRMKIPCEGYQIRLAWVDTETGSYLPQQRRMYPCELTWEGYPSYTLKEVTHLIDDCGTRQCRCNLHRNPSPFLAFQKGGEGNAIAPQDEGNGLMTATDPWLSGEELRSDCCSLIRGDIETIDPAPLMDPIQVEGSSPIDYTVQSYETNSAHNLKKSIVNMDVSGQDGIDPTMSIILSPSQSFTPNGIDEENHLFFHYVSYVSVLMTPIDDGRNPWRSTYPSIAVQGPDTSSSNALYYAILAQSAHSLSNLNGTGRGEHQRLNAMRYSGMAIREFRKSLRNPRANYSSVLGALLSIMLAEHVFQRNSQGWRHHIRGAMGFVSQFLAQQPWTLSHDAWIITQNFALSSVIAQTACSALDNSSEFIGEISHMLEGVMSRPGFGYTIGGTARLIRLIYQTRLLEEQLAAAAYERGIQEMDEDSLVQAKDIIQQLQAPLDAEVEMYIQQQEPKDTVVPRTRKLVNLHLQLFNGAVMIYLLRMVMQYPPSAVADYVAEVLAATMAFVSMHNSNVSIWPVFIAAVEAYTPESQALAEKFNSIDQKFAGNRKDIELLIREVWAERERLATIRQCDPGDISVDWRDVMKNMNLDILIL